MNRLTVRRATRIQRIQISRVSDSKYEMYLVHDPVAMFVGVDE